MASNEHVRISRAPLFRRPQSLQISLGQIRIIYDVKGKDRAYVSRDFDLLNCQIISCRKEEFIANQSLWSFYLNLTLGARLRCSSSDVHVTLLVTIYT